MATTVNCLNELAMCVILADLGGKFTEVGREAKSSINFRSKSPGGSKQ